MNLVVDQVPSNWSECVFAEKRPHDIFYAQCKLTGVSCGLDANGRCDRLLSLRELLNKRY